MKKELYLQQNYSIYYRIIEKLSKKLIIRIIAKNVKKPTKTQPPQN